MELSSILHYLNEAFHYKVDDHHYVLKIITKKNDCTKVRIGFMEKYFREKNMPGIPSEVFYVDCKKVASTSRNDYYEGIIPDKITLHGVNKKIDDFLNVCDNKEVAKHFDSMRYLENQDVEMIACAYFFLLENENEKKYYGNYKFYDHEPTDTMSMFIMVLHQENASYFKTPSWAKGAIIYQIFPERFAPTDLQYSLSWNQVPMQSNTRTNGSIKGIEQQIPYLKDLGVDAIYLTPIFLANSSHRYDSVDYMVIDPLLGSKDEFKSLVQKLHENGIKIILDLVFNHTSTQFFAFKDILQKQDKSKYKDWYFIKKFPVEMKLPSDYLSFSFFPGMPKLNTRNKDCRKYLFNVSRYYLEEFHIDGYRLDVANEVTHDFWKEFRKLCKSINPDCLIMGEIWYDSSTYLRGDEFDSIMNYTYFDAIRGLLTNKFSIEEFITIIERERGESSLTYYHNSNILVGSHDTDRIFNAINHDKNKFIQAMTLLFTLPGSPILYYGDEKMMEGGKDPDCRRGMIFDEKYHQDSFNLVKKLIELKKLPCLKYGDIKFFETKEYLKFKRFINEESIYIILNFKDKKIHINDFDGYINLITKSPFDGIIDGNGVVIITNGNSNNTK